MATEPAAHGRTGRPPRTSRAQILAAARRLIDREGWEKLTIRRLAGEIGVGATTLYHHIRNKEDLLVLLLNDHVGRIERGPLPDGPRDRVVAAATAMHDALAAWPWAAEVLTADGFVGRLDASALWMVEAVLAGSEDCGCTPTQAVDVFRSVWYLTVGEILVRARSARGRPVEPSFSGFDASRVPCLAAVGDRWPALAARDVYPETLRALVDGLLTRATSTQPSGPA